MVTDVPSDCTAWRWSCLCWNPLLAVYFPSVPMMQFAEHLFATKVARTCCQCNGGEQNGPWAAQGSYYIGNRCLPQLLLGGEELGAACLRIASLCDKWTWLRAHRGRHQLLSLSLIPHPQPLTEQAGRPLTVAGAPETQRRALLTRLPPAGS